MPCLAFLLTACQAESESQAQQVESIASQTQNHTPLSRLNKNYPMFSAQTYFERDIKNISEISFHGQVDLFQYLVRKTRRMSNQEQAEFSRLLADNHSYALTVEGYVYFSRRNAVEAEKMLLRAAEQGNPYAENRLGELYLLGMREIRPDRQKAMYWFERSAENNYAFAAFVLGAMYADIEFRKCRVSFISDEQQRAREIASNQCNTFIGSHGDIDGFYVKNIETLGEQANLAQAHYWFERSARLNYPPAVRILAKFPELAASNKPQNETHLVPESKEVQPSKPTGTNPLDNLM